MLDWQTFAEKYGNDIANQVKKAVDATYVYATPIIYSGKYPSKPVGNGSGIFATILGQKGIITNWHVVYELFISKNADVITIPISDTQSINIAFDSSKVCALKSNNDKDCYPDLAFIVFDSFLTELEIIMGFLGKQFFEFDKAKELYTSNQSFYSDENALWIVHGYVAEGSKIKKVNNQTTIDYRKGGPYIVVPDLDNITCTEYVHEVFGLIAIDIITCPILVQKRKKLPKSFEGMSGAGLWNVVFDEERNIEKISLVGVATTQDFNGDRLMCQGPSLLYKTFPKACVLNY